MTWYFDPTDTTMDVYDHTGTLVAEAVEFGGSWTGAYPTAIRDVMLDHAREQSNLGDANSESPAASAYTVETMLALLADDIERGTPSQ